MRAVGATILALSLAACGGGGDDDEPPATTANHTLKAGATVVDASNARLLAQDDASITLAGDAVAGLQAGDVIVSTLGQGALRRVVGVEALADGSRRFRTEQAALTDAFERFDLDFSRTLSRSDLGDTFDTGEPGLELRWSTPTTGQRGAGGESPQAAIDAAGLTISFRDWNIGVNRGFEIDGSASFRLQPDFGVNLVPVANSSIPALTYRASLSPAYSHQLTVSSSFGGSLAVSKEHKIQLKTIVLASPPVTIVPYIVVSAQASGTAAGKFSATNTASFNGNAFVSRDVDGLADAGHSLQPLMTGRFDSVEAGMSAEVTPVRIDFQFRLYDVGGPTFALGADLSASGAYERDGVTGAEGIRAILGGEANLSIGISGDLAVVKELFSDYRGDFSLFSMDFTLLESELFNEFFPFSGDAAIQVFDNGRVADDIFEVSLDGIVLGRTAKGGSGQFRVGSLRPGNHSLRLLTIEDDDPPGTWAVQLANGVTFANGSTLLRGELALGSSVAYDIVVPPQP